MQTEFLNRFEQKLEEELVRICTSASLLDGVLLASDDITEQWKVYAPEYLADAVNEIANYPVVSVAWAGYLGMAVATAWNADWNTYVKAPYQAFYGTQGFDDMDEHIVRDLLDLPLDSAPALAIEKILRQCGEATVSAIRREHIEPQSKMAYLIFAHASKAMYRIGAALELKRLGYKFEKVQL